MDNQQLFDNIKELHKEMRHDLKELDHKLDSYQERLIKVESTLGFIRVSLASALSAISVVVAYIVYKIIDFFIVK